MQNSMFEDSLRDMAEFPMEISQVRRKLQDLTQGQLMMNDMYDEMLSAVEDLSEMMRYTQFFKNNYHIEGSGVAKPIKL